MKKILIIDDQRGIRLLLNEVFSKNMYKVYQAANGMEALQILENQPIDCILLDMRIPGMNGIEILREIRERNLDMPIFMMTAFEEEEMVAEAKRLGVIKFFTKPFNVFDLRNEVNDILKMH